jgi:hypothetical protein
MFFFDYQYPQPVFAQLPGGCAADDPRANDYDVIHNNIFLKK